jgi:Protein of unknown function (DUF1320)
MSTWVTPRQALQMIGQKKLAQLTNEAGQQEFIGTGDGATVAFTTPFVFGLDLKVYADAVLSLTVTADFTKGERLVATFTTPPDTGVVITASSLDSVNADNLDSAFLRAQGLVRGALDAQMYSVPADVPVVPVTEPLLGWTSAIAWYLLATDPRRPRLLEAYPELEKRYIDVWGGVDSDLKRVAKGNFSLRGILTVVELPATAVDGTANFYSNDVVYTRDLSRGVQ